MHPLMAPLRVRLPPTRRGRRPRRPSRRNGEKTAPRLRICVHPSPRRWWTEAKRSRTAGTQCALRRLRNRTPTPVRRCAAASKGGALVWPASNPAPKTCVPAKLSAREAKARFGGANVYHTGMPTSDLAAAKPYASAVRRTYQHPGAFLSGSGTLSFGKHKRKRPGNTRLLKAKKQEREKQYTGDG